LEYIHGGNLRLASRIYGGSEKDFIDFSASINPLPRPPELKEYVLEALDSIKHYPDDNASVFVEKVSDVYGVPQENVLIGNGSSELIFFLSLINANQQALILSPSFSEYERSLLNNNCKVKKTYLDSLNNFNFNLDEAKALLPQAKIVYLCNPNNPTSNLILPKKGLLEFVKFASRYGVLVIVDEAFIDMVPDESLIKEASHSDNLIVLRSMTKFFGLAGLRLGFAVGPKYVIDKIKVLRFPWSINSLALSVGYRILGDREFMKESLEFLKTEREFLSCGLKGIRGLYPYPSSANFLFVRIDVEDMTSTELFHYLAKERMLIRDCSSFDGLDGKYFRVAVKDRVDNERLLEKLQEALNRSAC